MRIWLVLVLALSVLRGPADALGNPYHGAGRSILATSSRTLRRRGGGGGILNRRQRIGNGRSPSVFEAGVEAAFLAAMCADYYVKPAAAQLILYSNDNQKPGQQFEFTPGDEPDFNKLSGCDCDDKFTSGSFKAPAANSGILRYKVTVRAIAARTVGSCVF